MKEYDADDDGGVDGFADDDDEKQKLSLNYKNNIKKIYFYFSFLHWLLLVSFNMDTKLIFK